MSATVPVYVEVRVSRIEWRKVSAVTLEEARRIVEEQPDVLAAISATYDEPDEDVVDLG